MRTVTILSLFAFVAVIVSCASGCSDASARGSFSVERVDSPDQFGAVCYAVTPSRAPSISCVKVTDAK